MIHGMKILGLDIGGAWVGSALSDGAGITCRPYKTVSFEELNLFLRDLLKKEPINKVVVGHPITVGGGISDQTREIEEIFKNLKEQFSRFDSKEVEWLLWDERFSSKRAAAVSKKGDSKREHSIAAAFILQSYLDSLALARE